MACGSGFPRLTELCWTLLPNTTIGPTHGNAPLVKPRLRPSLLNSNKPDWLCQSRPGPNATIGAPPPARESVGRDRKIRKSR